MPQIYHWMIRAFFHVLATQNVVPSALILRLQKIIHLSKISALARNSWGTQQKYSSLELVKHVFTSLFMLFLIYIFLDTCAPQKSASLSSPLCPDFPITCSFYPNTIFLLPLFSCNLPKVYTYISTFFQVFLKR